MELLRSYGCLDYVGKEPEIPALSITVRETAYGRKAQLTAPVDTGFAGFVLLDRETYDDLATMESPREDFGVYQTMAGPVTLRRAEVKIRLRDEEVDSFIETPLYGTGKRLIGRRILNQLDIGLIGPERQCCLLEETERK